MLKVKLIAHTQDPEKVVAAAAKLCYSAADIDTLLDGLTAEKNAEFVQMLASLGHESPTEHVSFTFAIEGVSRALLAQITRHRIASYSVQSQRYVRLEDFKFVIPPEIEKDEISKNLFLQEMQKQATAYCELANSLKTAHTKQLISQGIDEKQAARLAEKKAIEDARFVLPNACETKMIVTMNTRGLQNFFRHRCCNRAQWEIQALADEMLKLVYPIAPSLFAKSGAPCAYGACPEGKMTCGKKQEMTKKYTDLKQEVLKNG